MSEHREYGEEERMTEHSGANHSMAIGFYIAAIVLIFGVTLVLADLISSGQQAQGNVGVILGMALASPRRADERQAAA